jgi:glycolate oxidase FAD binding subunit
MTTAAVIPGQEVPAGARLVEPADAAVLARELAAATKAGLAVMPRGGGTKSDWGNPPERADLVLSTRRLDRVLEHAAGDMTATVEAGCTIAKLQSALALRGQRLAIDPLWPDRATIGGVLATNDNGSLRGAFGSLRDLIIGATVALADGTLARSGGKVVKNVAGYDLPKLMVGAFGTLGVITQATFRLHPLPAATRGLSWDAPDANAMQTFVLAVLDSTVPVVTLQVRTCSAAAALAVRASVQGSREAVDAQATRLEEIAASCDVAPAEAPDPSPDAWPDCRDRLWDAANPMAVCKVTVQIAEFAAICHMLPHFAKAADSWSLCLEAAGAGWLRVSASPPGALAPTLRTVRGKLELLGGSLAVMRCPPDVKREVGAWGHAGDAQPLMLRVKEQFDPARTLNPGRFVGGI